jgi:hypothetical protein
VQSIDKSLGKETIQMKDKVVINLYEFERHTEIK